MCGSVPRYGPRTTHHGLNSFFGGYEAVVRPVPIPNTAVKHSLADGSGSIGSARVGCRQIFFKPKRKFRLFCCLESILEKRTEYSLVRAGDTQKNPFCR